MKESEFILRQASYFKNEIKKRKREDSRLGEKFFGVGSDYAGEWVTFFNFGKISRMRNA